MQVDLDDMSHRVNDEENSFCSEYPCRCGGTFVVPEEDLSETASSLLVQCQNCSLVIRVLYTLRE